MRMLSRKVENGLLSLVMVIFITCLAIVTCLKPQNHTAACVAWCVLLLGGSFGVGVVLVEKALKRFCEGLVWYAHNHAWTLGALIWLHRRKNLRLMEREIRRLKTQNRRGISELRKKRSVTRRAL